MLRKIKIISSDKFCRNSEQEVMSPADVLWKRCGGEVGLGLVRQVEFHGAKRGGSKTQESKRLILGE